MKEGEPLLEERKARSYSLDSQSLAAHPRRKLILYGVSTILGLIFLILIIALSGSSMGNPEDSSDPPLPPVFPSGTGSLNAPFSVEKPGFAVTVNRIVPGSPLFGSSSSFSHEFMVGKLHS